MLHSSYFNGIWKKNKGVKDVRFKFATVAVFVRRVLDKMGLFSCADVEKDITCALKQDFEEFDITVDKKNAQVVLEADIWGIGTLDNERRKAQALERINEYNQHLQFGYCMLIDNRVIYRIRESIYLGADDAEDLAVAERLIRRFETDVKYVDDKFFDRAVDNLNELTKED